MSYKKRVLELSNRMRLIHIDKNKIIVQARYGPSKFVRLPLNINGDLACFVALVIGDGHISKNKFRTTIESSNIKLLRAISKIIYSLFNINAPIKKVKKRKGRLQTHHISIYSKAVCELLNFIFKIPRGKKSNLVRVPVLISKGNKKFYSPFVIGLLATEGSKKDKKRIRICSASCYLLENVKGMLKKLNIKSSIESWINKKYKKRYYSISFKRNNLDSFMRECRSGQTGQILDIFKKITED